MKLIAALGLLAYLATVAAWSALNFDAVGAADGVLWCIGFLAAVGSVLIVGAWWESKQERTQP